MPLILTEQILADLVRALQSQSKGTLDDEMCLDIVADSFGLPNPLALLAAVSESGEVPPPVPEEVPPVLEFWQSGLLNSFITDYSCRRQPVVAMLSGHGSIILLSQSPLQIFEIAEGASDIDLKDVGTCPWPSAPPKRVGAFPTPALAFDHLCQTQNWDWSHSSINDVS